MKKKTCTQYKCDFCGKMKYSKYLMNIHEVYCTLNPNRECRLCILISGKSSNLSELLKNFPDPKIEYCDGSEAIENIEEINDGIDKIAKITENCPACILSVLSQKGIHPKDTKFNYQQEIRIFWNDYNYSRDYTLNGYL